jgi:hypothetical protein
MTDDQLGRLEQLFDGELAHAEGEELHASTAADATAARYLSELGALRELARRHDPAATVPRSRPLNLSSLGAARGRIARRGSAVKAHLLILGLAATAALVWLAVSLAVNSDRRSVPGPGWRETDRAAVLSRSRPGKRPLAVRSIGSKQRANTTVELEVLRWMGNAHEVPQSLLMRLLGPHRPRRSLRRPGAGREMLAIELANDQADQSALATTRQLLTPRSSVRRRDGPPRHETDVLEPHPPLRPSA